MTPLLSRFADNSYWLARYVERAENLARVLDVTETFSQDRNAAEDWQAILQIYSDEKVFAKTHDKLTARNVLLFYLIDRSNLNSVASSIDMARNNARSLRHLISTEMWLQLNVFDAWLDGMNARKVTLSGLSGLCTQIKEACQTHTGLVEGTLFRDQVWLFYNLGKQIERADQISRLLDIKYYQMEAAGADEQADISWWNTLLRSAAGYHAFRRQHPRGLSPEKAVDFLLVNPDFPRSLTCCVNAAGTYLAAIEKATKRKTGSPKDRPFADLKALATGSTVRQVMSRGLHEHIDDVQLKIDRLNSAVHDLLFV